jgi:glycosyltransferase involved in cell wall biosynthesis
MPRVTVLLAVYNGAAHLGAAIDSILGQTYHDFELLIVNDGSTDRSREIVLSYRDPRIRLLDNERNLGLATSLNIGMAAASGEYVARQDADDVSEPNRLERQVQFLDAHPHVALAGTWYSEIDGAGRLLARHELPRDWTAIRWALLFFCPFIHSAVMLRRTPVLSQIGGYDESLTCSLDYELWTRIARSMAVANLAEYLVRWRTHAASMTATIGDRALEGHRLRVQRVARMLRWAERGLEDHDARFRTLDALYRGAMRECDPARTFAAVDELLLLQRVFCGEARLAEAECRVHRALVLRRIARTLVALARMERARIGTAGTLRLYLIAIGVRVQARWLDFRTRAFRRESSPARRGCDFRALAQTPGGGAPKIASAGYHEHEPAGRLRITSCTGGSMTGPGTSSARPRVSVVTPFLNAERFIAESIESVLTQTYPSWELLLVDDGSTDTSTAIACSYAERYPDRIRYFEHEGHGNRGVSASRNVAIRHARGEYIALLDADDVWLPHKLEQQVRLLDARPEVGSLYGDTRYWYSWTGREEDRDRDFEPKLGYPPNTVLLPPTLLIDILRQRAAVPCTCSIIMRRSVVVQVDGFVEEFRSLFTDQSFFSKLFLAAPVLVADSCWDMYRQHADSSCSAAERAGLLRQRRAEYLRWFEELLSARDLAHGELWRALQAALWPYRHPRLHRVRRALRHPRGAFRRALAIARGLLPRVAAAAGARR